MDTLRQRIERRLREEICDPCREDRGLDSCAEGDDFCPLMDRLDDLVAVVSGIKDYSLEPYRDKVGEIICSTCRADEDGSCRHRQSHDCALEEYFPKIVAILEEELKSDPAIS